MRQIGYKLPPLRHPPLTVETIQTPEFCAITEGFLGDGETGSDTEFKFLMRAKSN